ncbi:hypothetical protein B296_00036652 [Ensete ventricosum]|uniref:Uncharacterized protein n=1 Tax=Ensete ventricosum TaxID=4639 RepID=A0A426Y7R8_ENSVE|nr:hypothetical protein B296_00036652 [Ensete ventricosum]
MRGDDCLCPSLTLSSTLWAEMMGGEAYTELEVTRGASRWCAVAVVLSLGIAARAFLHRSLDRSGAIAGFLVMAIHIAADYRFAALLLVFFFTSSKLTKMGEEKKRSIEEDFKEGGQRNW